MVNHKKDRCVECDQIAPCRSGTYRCNNFLCWKCKRKTHFNILGKNNQPVAPAGFNITPKYSPVSLLKPEAKLLWIKHIRQSGNEIEANNAVHQIRYWTKVSHNNYRDKSKNQTKTARFSYPK